MAFRRVHLVTHAVSCLLMGTGAVHLLTPFVAMTGSIAVRRITAVVQAATVINLVIEL